MNRQEQISQLIGHIANSDTIQAKANLKSLLSQYVSDAMEVRLQGAHDIVEDNLKKEGVIA